MIKVITFYCDEDYCSQIHRINNLGNNLMVCETILKPTLRPKGDD